MTDFLQQYLAETDAPCPCCAYNLRGLTGGVCPECGEALELRVGLVEPKLGSFVAGLVGLAGGAGFHAIVLGWFLWVSLFRTYAPDLREAIPLVIGLAVCGGATWAWMAMRQRIRHLNFPVRFALVAACWMVSFLTALLFFAVVR